MDRIRILGGKPLSGAIPIGGAKNAALPLMAAGLLTGETLTLTNLPRLVDISTMAQLLGELGVDVDMEEGGRCTLSAADVSDTAPYNLVRKMRAGVLVLGPLLARLGHARVSLPGGCAIGTRPIDLHLDAFKALGAEIELEEGYVRATAPGGLKGAHVLFPSVSVGATENVLMAATLAAGETLITNASRAPEVADLARCLQALGARVEGVGTDTLTVTGVAGLHGADYQVIPDRIESGSYAVAAAITGGEIILRGARLDLMDAVADVLAKAGVEMTETEGGVSVKRHAGHLRCRHCPRHF
ncbi:MAG: UDP-N-acetylglucosamine 1-carboxyvinyltransferase [Proteobacteria bacterium]|nr:UDP-N-acetylglucosamine 1-carboxyvinyltransferase [Pseudomonadota bacterium]